MKFALKNAALCAVVLCSTSAFGFGSDSLFGIKDAAQALSKARGGTDKAPLEGQIETAFSPDGASEALILKVIQSSTRSIRLAAYSFTSPGIVRALIDAKRRGIDVAVVVDHKQNVNGNSGGAKARAALNLLVNAGIPTRTISRYPIHHDKFIVADGVHTQSGSYNYSEAAAKRNSENVIVIWNNAKVAASYLKHWQSRYEQGTDYQSTY
jgi:phosphatidylserine/phosphatidylglycerophosphate/cardiolipin synthase-like enzyme